MKKLNYLISLSLVTAALADTTSLKDALGEALYTENVIRNLDAAAKNYASIVDSFRKNDAPVEQRAYVASALFRLAEIRDQQGRKEEAGKLYKEFLENFSDHRSEAQLVRKKLGVTGPEPRQKLVKAGKDVLSENVVRTRWNFDRKMRQDELLMTTFEVKHKEGLANEGLPPAYEVKTLHYAPSGHITKWFSHTQVNWTSAEITSHYQKWKKETGKDVWLGYDRRNYISGFGHSYVVPEGLGLNYTGGGSGSASMAFFFTNKSWEKEPDSGDYKKVEATKWLIVRLVAEPCSLKRARALTESLKMELPEMGDEAWSLTLPASPAELQKTNKAE